MRISALLNIVPESLALKAEKVWSERTQSFEGQKECIESAANDQIAFAYLWARSSRAMYKMFWNSFYANLGKEGLDYDEAQDFVALCHSAFLQSLQYLDFSKVDERAAPFGAFIHKLKWDIIAELKKYLPYKYRHGLTGKAGTGSPFKPHTVIGSLDYERGTEPGTPIEDPLVEKENWEEFFKDPALDMGRAPTLREVLNFFLENDYNAEKAAKTFNTTYVTIRSKLKALGVLFDRYGIDSTSFTSYKHTN